MPATNGVRYTLAEFGRNQAADSRALAELHAELLPQSALPRLGRGFLEHFYYSVLPKEDLLFGCIAYLDGVPAGFMVNTPQPGRYMGLAIRRHPVRFAWRMAVAALTRPGSVMPALRARKRMASQASSAETSQAAAPEYFLEGLFMAVRPQYTRPGFMREFGIHISRDLVSRSLSMARRYGAPEMRAAVMRTNIAALMALLKAGWEIKEEGRCLVSSEDHVELSYSFAGDVSASRLTGGDRAAGLKTVVP